MFEFNNIEFFLNQLLFKLVIFIIYFTINVSFLEKKYIIDLFNSNFTQKFKTIMHI